MIVFDEGLSEGLVHGVDVGDGLRVEEEGEPQDPKLSGPHDRSRLKVLGIGRGAKGNAPSAPVLSSVDTIWRQNGIRIFLTVFLHFPVDWQDMDLLFGFGLEIILPPPTIVSPTQVNESRCNALPSRKRFEFSNSVKVGPCSAFAFLLLRQIGRVIILLRPHQPCALHLRCPHHL